jgi:hypothetical protein
LLVLCSPVRAASMKVLDGAMDAIALLHAPRCVGAGVSLHGVIGNPA